MKAARLLPPLIAVALLLSGCWSQMEMTDRAFVLALAIDKGGEDELEATVQIYKPISQFGPPSGQGQEQSFHNVTLRGTSVSNIIRNTKTVTGRHSQFSHIRLLLISDEVARERLADILDFFYRDPEIRLGMSVMIARGRARDYLVGRPIIENTLGSQLFKQLDFSSKLAGKTLNTTMLDLAFGLKSESESAMLPVITHERQYNQDVVRGIALVKPDRMVGSIPPDMAPYLLLMADRYKYGLLEIPCRGDNELAETIEVLRSDAKISPRLEGRSPSARIEVRIDASINELACTTIRDMADEAAFAERARQYFKERMESVLGTLRKRKADALGIGNRLYSRHPGLWRKIKSEWPEIYARMPIELDVKVYIRNSKMMKPGPFSRIGDN